ncbi:MAG: RnfABCDGE type electron transport complex subunit D [Ruminococcus sp.]|nr:RnfABCDGE type electron transport complex subunit D [Ruminococcus sp.]
MQSFVEKSALKGSSDNPFYKYNFDTMIIGIVLAASAVFYYGRRAFVIVLISVLCSVAAQIAVSLLLKKGVFNEIIPAMGVGLINALILPVTIPYSAVIIAAVVSVAILRNVFGGQKFEVINPSAGALLFLFYAFPGKLQIFTNIFPELPLTETVYPDGTVSSFFGSLINAGLTVGDYPELLAGRLPFVMGGCSLLIIASLLMYIIRKDISGFAFIAAGGSFFGISFLAGGGLRAAVYALAGVLPAMVLTALPVSSRFSSVSAKIIYGVLLGLVCSLFVWYSKNEYGGYFACVILSPLSAYFANNEWNLKRILPAKLRRMKLS